MKILILALSIFFIGFTFNPQANAQTVSQVYGYKLTQQHVNVYYHFMGLAKGVALTSQEKAFIKQNVMNNFKANPIYILNDANMLLAAKKNPYQSMLVVNNYRATMQQQQQANSYQYQGNGGGMTQQQYEMQRDWQRQNHKTNMEIINNFPDY